MSARWGALFLVLAGLSLCGAARADTTSAAQAALGRFAAAWDGVRGYRCIFTAHEELGSNVQDRTYALVFVKPSLTRIDVIGGDGRGSAAVWRGGEKLRGHRGGFLRFIVGTISINSRMARSLRGTTIAQTSFGAFYDHLTQTPATSISATQAGGMTTITALVANPAADHNVTKEVVVLGADGLPVEYDQFEGEREVKKIVFSGVRVNVRIPASTFDI